MCGVWSEAGGMALTYRKTEEVMGLNSSSLMIWCPMVNSLVLNGSSVAKFNGPTCQYRFGASEARGGL